MICMETESIRIDAARREIAERVCNNTAGHERAIRSDPATIKQCYM